VGVRAELLDAGREHVLQLAHELLQGV